MEPRVYLWIVFPKPFFNDSSTRIPQVAPGERG